LKLAHYDRRLAEAHGLSGSGHAATEVAQGPMVASAAPSLPTPNPLALTSGLIAAGVPPLPTRNPSPTRQIGMAAAAPAQSFADAIAAEGGGAELLKGGDTFGGEMADTPVLQRQMGSQEPAGAVPVAGMHEAEPMPVSPFKGVGFKSPKRSAMAAQGPFAAASRVSRPAPLSSGGVKVRKS
jgi:hypothetical protein